MKKVGNYWLPDYDTWFEKAFERKQFWAIRKKAISLCKRFRTAIDVGAHVGTWAVPLAGKFKSVWAFEPIESNLSCLKTNLAGVGLLDKVHCVQSIVSDYPNPPTTLTMMVPGNSGTWKADDFPSTRKDVSTVPVVSIDSCDIQDVDFLKVDAEWMELEALHGAIKTINRYKPVICIETHCLNKIDHFLSRLGYRLQGSVDRDYIYIHKGDL